jgi:hypothetical protein
MPPRRSRLRSRLLVRRGAKVAVGPRLIHLKGLEIGELFPGYVKKQKGQYELALLVIAIGKLITETGLAFLGRSWLVVRMLPHTLESLSLSATYA